MRLRCQTCSSELDVVDRTFAIDVKCPSCGSRVELSSVVDTMIYVPPKLGWLGQFELVEHIGRGHYGDVYRAHDSRLGRLVAVKVPRTGDFDPAEREAFYREARTAARLRHPNIVTIYDVDSVGETTYIASELIDGANLADVLADRKLEPRRAAEIAARVADALHHAHDQGVIHRDLKPRNIMLDTAGEPHLLDFGLAKHSTGDFTITAEGDILGTPAYMAPEQARGQSGSADRRTDVYALGVTLYEMLAGQRPFAGEPRGLIYQILNEEPPPPRKLTPTIPRDLETICLKAMAKQPEARYATAADLAADLRRYLAGEPIRARRAGPLEHAWRWCRRNPGVSIATGVAALAIGLLAASQVFRPPPELFVPPRVAIQDPPDPAFTHRVVIATEPAGATVVCYPLEFATGRPQFSQAVRASTQTPTEVELTNGMYLVVAHKGDLFHEVYRSVPKLSYAIIGPLQHELTTWDKSRQAILWPTIKLFPTTLPGARLAHIPGKDRLEISLPSPGGGKQAFRVPAFGIELTEVTVGEYARLGTHRHRGQDIHMPAGRLSWGEAVAYAESLGMRLPDLAEIELVATAGGTQLFPWGDRLPPADNWVAQPINVDTHDRLTTDGRIIGLHSGLFEWLATRPTVGYGADGPGLRYLIRGASVRQLGSQKLASDAGPCASVNEYVRNSAIGVRCARSPGPRLKEAGFLMSVP